MTLFPEQFLVFFQWLIRCSFHGTILLAIILLIRAVVKKKFQFSMVYWLWMLLLVRLIWPLNVQTTFSVFNLIPQKAVPGQHFSTPAAEEPTVSLSGEQLVSSSEAADTTLMSPAVVSKNMQEPTAPVRTLPLVVASDQARFDWVQLWCVVWLAGTIVLAGCVMFSNFRLWRIVKYQRLITRQDILELLEDCKAQLGLQTVVGVVETDKIRTPCLFGYLRPLLLLPVGTLEQMSGEQIRYVFLHELSHLKRHDILIGWLMAVVQILHWFNPAVWYAMAQISADRELACDELTLLTLAENEPQAYGSTILAFLEKFTKKQHLPGMAGIAENQSLLRRRMTMISTFKNKKASFIPAILILALLAATTLTSANQTESTPQGLNDAQKVYQEWTNQTFGSVNDSKYASLSDAAKGEMENIWLQDLKKGPQAGSSYYEAIDALAAIKSQKAFMPLAKIAFEKREKNNQGRWMATRALGIIGDERAIPKMIHLVYHYNMNTRFWAQISLVNMTGQNFGTDWRAWGDWWNKQDKESKFNATYIKWTKNREWADPEQQKKVDAEFIAKYKNQSGESGQDEDAPQVVSTSPQAMSTDVEPGKYTLTVSFDQTMTDQSWSWTGGGDTYPQTLSRPAYSADRKTCKMEAMLEPGKVYWVGINSPSYRNFKSASGIPAKGYVILFATKDSEGNPTPIPEEMLRQAERINAATRLKTENE